MTYYKTEMTSAHLDAIVQLQHSLMPAKKHWSIDEARAVLTDSAHGKGANVILLWDSQSNKLLAVGAWVIGSRGESFGSPFLAATEDSASTLLEAIENEARTANANWLRVITLDIETAKSRSLDKRKFQRTFDFVEFEINPGSTSNSELNSNPHGLISVPIGSLDYKKYIEVGNLAFKNVDNALPLTEGEAKEIWETECDHGLSQVLGDTEGNYVGFTVVTSKGYIDSVGVHPHYQGKGVARALYQHVINTAAARGMNRLYTVVSSQNIQSLRLHEKMGFHESERRQVWELSFQGK